MSAEKRQKRFPNLRAGSRRTEKQSGKKPARDTSGLKRGGSPGRPRGVPNKATREVKILAQSILEDALVQRRMLEDARRGRLAPPVMTMLFAYAYGKPKETIDVNVVEELRVTVTDDIGEDPTSLPTDTEAASPVDE